MRVAVVGAGIHGASSAYALANRGHSVTIFEQFALGHDRGSSHGQSRIVRRAYPDPFYTEIMVEGYPLWHDLEMASGKKILYESGLLYFGPRDSPNIGSLISGLDSLQVEHREFNLHDIHKVFPGLILYEGEIGVFTPEAGWAHASLAIESSIRLAQSKGAEIRHERVTDLDPLLKAFDSVVLCQGAWIKQFVKLPVTITLQTFGYLSGEMGGPVWIEDSEDAMYGCPTEPWGSGIKVGVHFGEREQDADDGFRDPAPGAIDLIKEFGWRRFGFDRPTVVDAKGCLYTRRDNEDFFLGQIDERVFFASPCTGHGFKFGPWVGKTMADFVEGKKTPSDYPRFLP